MDKKKIASPRFLEITTTHCGTEYRVCVYDIHDRLKSICVGSAEDCRLHIEKTIEELRKIDKYIQGHHTLLDKETEYEANIKKD